MGRVSAKISREERKLKLKDSYQLDQTNDVFVTINPKDAEESSTWFK